MPSIVERLPAVLSDAAVRLLVTIGRAPDVEARGDLKVVAAGDPRRAVSLAYGFSATGRRAAVLLGYDELVDALPALLDVRATGVRGGLLAIVKYDPASEDPRLASEALWCPLIEPLVLDRLPRYVEAALELSEALELPILLSVPSFKYAAELAPKASGLDVEPIFSRHWGRPHRWVPRSPSRDELRALSRIFRRLISRSDLVARPEAAGTTILCFGAAYQIVRESCPDEVVASVSLIGLPIHVPSCALPPPAELLRPLERVRRVLVLEPRLPLLESWLASSLPDEIEVCGILPEERPYPELVYRSLAARIEELRSREDELYELETQSLVPAIIRPPGEAYDKLLTLLAELQREVDKLVVTAASWGCAAPVLAELAVSRAKPDYDVRSRRYSVKTHIDCFDVVARRLSPEDILEGMSMAGLDAVKVLVMRGEEAARGIPREGWELLVLLGADDEARRFVAEIADVVVEVEDPKQAAREISKALGEGRRAAALIRQGA